MSFADRFFAFFNGMVAGTLLLMQAGRKFLSCNLSKSSKSDCKLSPSMPKFIMVYLTALAKSSRMKAHWLCTKVWKYKFRNFNSLDWCRNIGLSKIWSFWKLQKLNGKIARNPHFSVINSLPLIVCVRYGVDQLFSYGKPYLIKSPI